MQAKQNWSDWFIGKLASFNTFISSTRLSTAELGVTKGIASDNSLVAVLPDCSPESCSLNQLFVFVAVPEN